MSTLYTRKAYIIIPAADRDQEDAWVRENVPGCASCESTFTVDDVPVVVEG